MVVFKLTQTSFNITPDTYLTRIVHIGSFSAKLSKARKDLYIQKKDGQSLNIRLQSTLLS